VKHKATRYSQDKKQKQKESVLVSLEVFVPLLSNNPPQKKLMKQHRK